MTYQRTHENLRPRINPALGITGQGFGSPRMSRAIVGLVWTTQRQPPNRSLPSRPRLAILTLMPRLPRSAIDPITRAVESTLGVPTLRSRSGGVDGTSAACPTEARRGAVDPS